MTRSTLNNNQTIAVAMSGGVDSSVTAAMLLNQGYNVFGVTMRLWNEDSKRVDQTIDSVQKVCSFLEIPFYELDLRKQFQQIVVGYYLQSQLEGRTPNPCFVCNQSIKWGLLLDGALEIGADFLATGHYARVIHTAEGLYELHKGLDAKKDQSYVLAGLTQSQLSRAMLPIGALIKEEVREIARSYSLPVPVDNESQDLCFLGSFDQEQFLTKYLGRDIRSGTIQTLNGQEIGEHNGLVHYTVGQRKGLGSGNPVPIYVLSKRMETNTLIVGTKDQLGCKRVSLSGLHWISGVGPKLPLHCSLKIRYKASPVYGTIGMDEIESYVIDFDEKVRDATPGQFIVFYDNDNVLGSAEIDQIFLEEK